MDTKWIRNILERKVDKTKINMTKSLTMVTDRIMAQKFSLKFKPSNLKWERLQSGYFFASND